MAENGNIQSVGFAGEQTLQYISYTYSWETFSQLEPKLCSKILYLLVQVKIKNIQKK